MSEPLPRSRLTPTVVLAAILGVAAIGVVDYATGIEIRVFPLYYLPISIAAWWSGHRAALGVATLSAIAWLASNDLAGQRTGPWIDTINFCMQLGSFALVGALIARLHSAYTRERALGHTDPLTGLLNSRGFFDQVPRALALAHRHEQPLTVAYLDLDNFKQVNDTLGHAAGDDVLREAASILAAGLRRGDFAARLGGDEFALVLPQTDEAGARHVLERLHHELQDGVRRHCEVAGTSMGAVAFAHPPEDVDELLRRADRVMYAVKAAGRGRVVVETAPPCPT
ncbi:GGDEF domain-containing protein [Paraliomyxa miuraensis]|uniref:GGDEF domain-containing protein n=1 Tax=Paraliomyxa miuraensis TaxID=376150 RepID=UPI002B1CBB94|nr:GGDEF domain-containing protein [Paraliomyxa miuraensis]